MRGTYSRPRPNDRGQVRGEKMITLIQAKEYLSGQGIDAPEFILEAWIEQLASINGCLESNYPPGTALLIQSYLLSLFALAQADRYIASQSAPSGASRSFRYQSFADRWSGALALLRALDKHGCADQLIPPSPLDGSHAGIWVARGGCK